MASRTVGIKTKTFSRRPRPTAIVAPIVADLKRAGFSPTQQRMVKRIVTMHVKASQVRTGKA